MELRFSCYTVDMDKLHSLIGIMNRDLSIMQMQLDSARKDYFCLNYYTNEQLLFLRKELYQLRNDTTAVPSSQMLMLLKSVSQSFSLDHLQKYLENVEKLNPAVSASSLSPAMALANLSQESFSMDDNERKIFMSLFKEFLRRQLVYDALAAISDDDKILLTEDAVREWCLENEYKYIDIPEEDFSCVLLDSPEQPQEDITEDHKYVKILLEEEGYKLDVAILAVQKAGSNASYTDVRNLADDIENGITESSEEHADEL